MKIEVELTEQDHIQMQIDHGMNSAYLRWMKRLLFILGIFSLLLLLFFILTGFANESSFEIGSFAILASIGMVCLLSPIFIKPLLKVGANAIVKEGGLGSQIGMTTYEFSDKTFTRKNSMRYEKLDWQTFEKVLETKNHIYLYDSSVSAYIIPKRELDEGAIQKIIEIAENRITGNIRLSPIFASPLITIINPYSNLHSLLVLIRKQNLTKGPIT